MYMRGMTTLYLIVTFTGELVQMCRGTGMKCTSVFNSKDKATAFSEILDANKATTGKYDADTVILHVCTEFCAVALEYSCKKYFMHVFIQVTLPLSRYWSNTCIP